MSTAGQGSRGREQDQAGSGGQPGVAAQATSRGRIRRFEFGTFVRKVVNRRVVSEWQFPPRRRPDLVQHSGSGGQALQQASISSSPPPAEDAVFPSEGEVRAQASRSAAASDDGGSNTEESTSYEAGFFFKSESSSPPEYPTEPVKG